MLGWQTFGLPPTNSQLPEPVGSEAGSLLLCIGDRLKREPRIRGLVGDKRSLSRRNDPSR